MLVAELRQPQIWLCSKAGRCIKKGTKTADHTMQSNVVFCWQPPLFVVSLFVARYSCKCRWIQVLYFLQASETISVDWPSSLSNTDFIRLASRRSSAFSQPRFQFLLFRQREVYFNHVVVCMIFKHWKIKHFHRSWVISTNSLAPGHPFGTKWCFNETPFTIG